MKTDTLCAVASASGQVRMTDFSTETASAMLDRLQQLARHLLPIRRILLGLAASGSVFAGIGLFAFADKEGDALLMPGLIILLWAITGLIFIDVFAHVPLPPEPAWSPRRRQLRTLWRGLHWLLMAGFAVLGMVAIDVSLHIADVWLQGQAQ